MNKHHHEHGCASKQTKRFFVGQLQGCLGNMWVKQPLTYITTLFTLAALLFAIVLFVRTGNAWARPLLQAAPFLGTAASFAVLAGSTATNTGPTVVTGDLGVSPASAVTGFPPGIVVGGTIHAADAVAAQAQADATVAYNNLAGQACNTNLTGQDLGGQTLAPGVYCFETSAQLTGALTLDGQGNPNAVFIFQIGSTLTTASAASVLLLNGASACNVFWQVGSSATLGTNTAFVGTLLALVSNTLTTDVTLSGRAIALTGAVTMDTNIVSTAGCASTPTTSTATATGTATPTATGTLIPTVTTTATSTATDRATPTATNTPIATSTVLPIATGTPTSTATSTETPMIIATGVSGPTGEDPVDEPIVSQTLTVYLPLVIQ
jgi:Ice-binding-like